MLKIALFSSFLLAVGKLIGFEVLFSANPWWPLLYFRTQACTGRSCIVKTACLAAGSLRSKEEALCAARRGYETYAINNARGSASRTFIALSSQEKLEQIEQAQVCSQVEGKHVAYSYRNLGV